MEFFKVQERTSRAIQQELGTLEEILAQAHAKNTLLKEQFRLLKEPKARLFLLMLKSCCCLFGASAFPFTRRKRH